MIAIPFLLDGSPVQLRFRNLGDGPKYLSMSGQPGRIYNVDAIKRASNTIHVCEGEFDAMILGQVGFDAIAIQGAEGFKPHFAKALAGFNRIWVWGDPDAAGAEFIQKVTNRLPRSAKGVKLRAGDVTDTYLAGGVKVLHSLVKED